MTFIKKTFIIGIFLLILSLAQTISLVQSYLARPHEAEVWINTTNGTRVEIIHVDQGFLEIEDENGTRTSDTVRNFMKGWNRTNPFSFKPHTKPGEGYNLPPYRHYEG